MVITSPIQTNQFKAGVDLGGPEEASFVERLQISSERAVDQNQVLRLQPGEVVTFDLAERPGDSRPWSRLVSSRCGDAAAMRPGAVTCVVGASNTCWSGRPVNKLPVVARCGAAQLCR